MDTLEATRTRERPRFPPIVDEVVEALRQAFGERLHAIALYGSYARGDATPDSDIDFLVVAEGESYDTSTRAYDAINDLWFRHDCWPVISLHCTTPEHFDYIMSIRTSFARSLIREGVELWSRRANSKSDD